MRRSRWIGWDAAAAPDGDIKTLVRLVLGSICLSVIEPNQTTKKATGGTSETGWLPVGLLVLLLLGSAAPALAELGFDMARISPEASPRITILSSGAMVLARLHLRRRPVRATTAGFGRTCLVLMRMNQVLGGTNATTTSSTRSLTSPHGLLSLPSRI